MRQKQFIKIASKYQSGRIVNDIYEPEHMKDHSLYRRIKYRFEELESLKMLTESIDFGCNFNKKGGCRNTDNERCCCTSCKSSHGHFRIIRQSDVPRLARHFDERTGFWRKDKGCILPRKLRSITCITYNCCKSEQTDNMLHALGRAMYLVVTRIKEHVEELKKKNQY